MRQPRGLIRNSQHCDFKIVSKTTVLLTSSLILILIILTSALTMTLDLLSESLHPFGSILQLLDIMMTSTMQFNRRDVI